jgi:hypothetical protein
MSTVRHHWADPYYGAFGFVAALVVIVCLAIVLVSGFIALAHGA